MMNCMRGLIAAIRMAMVWVFMRAVEMISRPDGKISHTKLAGATGHLVGTYWFCALNADKGFDVDLWIVYFTVVVGHHQINKLQDIVAALKGSGSPR